MISTILRYLHTELELSSSYRLANFHPNWLLSNKMHPFNIHYLHCCWGPAAHWNRQGCMWSASEGWRASPGWWNSFQSHRRQRSETEDLRTLLLSGSPTSQSPKFRLMKPYKMIRWWLHDVNAMNSQPEDLARTWLTFPEFSGPIAMPNSDLMKVLLMRLVTSWNDLP